MNGGLTDHIWSHFRTDAGDGEGIHWKDLGDGLGETGWDGQDSGCTQGCYKSVLWNSHFF